MAQTSIRDMDISCYENSRGAIQGCNLSVEVDIQPHSTGTAEALLQCQAELHWFQVGGGSKHVAGSQTQEIVNLYGGNLRKRVMLNFDFGSPGASGATVENQQCRTQAYASSGYDDSSGTLLLIRISPSSRRVVLPICLCHHPLRGLADVAPGVA